MRERFKFISAMLIFGSIGLFVKNIQLSSSEIALLRGIIGSLFLSLISFIVKQKLSLKALKGNLFLLVLSGALIGFNWILLFEAYRYTTISNATISYYFAPIFVMILAPILLKEKLTKTKVISLIVAMVGLLLIAYNGDSNTVGSYHHPKGIMYGLSAAALYASVIIINKFITNLSGYEITLIQLFVAAIVLAPYVYIKDHFTFTGLNSQSIVYIIILGIIHTGFAYYLYFVSIQKLKGHTIAVLSYIDPISAVVIASIFLGESMSVKQIIGGLRVLGSTFFAGEGAEIRNKSIKDINI